jgi:hypothetical protein
MFKTYMFLYRKTIYSSYWILTEEEDLFRVEKRGAMYNLS